MAQSPVAIIVDEYASATVGNAFTFSGVTASGGDILWSMEGQATGVLTGESTANPTFTPTSTGYIVFTLTVTYGTETATDHITLF